MLPRPVDLTPADTSSYVTPQLAGALRLPYDLATFPQAPTFVAAYSLLEPSMYALAAALFGRAGFPGRLPVSIPEIASAGFSLG
jgi:beta-N-acetylhexosaminidase